MEMEAVAVLGRWIPRWESVWRRWAVGPGSLAQRWAGARSWVGVTRCALCLLPRIVLIPVCSSQHLMNSFMRLINSCSLFIMVITQTMF